MRVVEAAMTQSDAIQIDQRLTRLESLFASAGEMMLQATNLSTQNAQQIERNSQQIERNSQQIDRLFQLVERNAQQIERNSQQIERNAQSIIQLHHSMADLALRSANDRAEFEEWRRIIQAALETIDRVLDYLMQRDGQDQP